MRFDSITAPVKVEISVQIYTTATTDHAILIDFYTYCYKRYEAQELPICDMFREI